MSLLTSSGVGPDILLVHGVGVGPESFIRTAAALEACGHRVHGVVRPGYGDDDGGRTLALEEQVDLVAEMLAARRADDAVWVGVSGGATLGVIAAMRRPTSIRTALLHEPLIGSAAEELQRAVSAAARRLVREGTDAAAHRRAVVEFMIGLVGGAAWEALGPAGRAVVLGREQVIRDEVPRFVSFEAGQAPDDGRVGVVVTVGEHSPPMRHEAAARAAERLHGSVVVVDGVGHLPQVEAPDAFAELIRRNT